MAWISLFFLLFSVYAAPLPVLMTKHPVDTLRFITMDGRFAYVKKRPGVLGLVSSFRSTDFLSADSFSDFVISSSRFKQRLAIETIPNTHSVYSLVKNHKISVVNWGEGKLTELGLGKNAKLHLNDEWITYFNPVEKIIHIQNVITLKKYDIRLTSKTNPFYVPDVEMVTPENVVYTDINDNGYVALVTYNLISKKSTLIYKSPLNGTRIELCQNQDYLAIGEFPYEGTTRGSKIMQIKIGQSTNLSGYTTIYNSVDSDLGNIVCMKEAIYFLKTINQEKALTLKSTDVARLDLKTQEVKLKTNMGNVGQLIEMDERLMIPQRGQFFVLEGKSNLETDVLKGLPNPKEELSP